MCRYWPANRALRNGAPFKDWPLPATIERARRKLTGTPEGDRQMVKVLAAVLTDGLQAVDAACTESLSANIASRLKQACRVDVPHAGADRNTYEFEKYLRGNGPGRTRSRPPGNLPPAVASRRLGSGPPWLAGGRATTEPLLAGTRNARPSGHHGVDRSRPGLTDGVYCRWRPAARPSVSSSTN